MVFYREHVHSRLNTRSMHVTEGIATCILGLFTRPQSSRTR